ncbi:hypothetical protein FVE85_3608 [Porphyridium purpureum]|uniref:Uncharacterized protein n=1 Tax=Porphyridium purpureum TaxID=35688 RepID=A0A5J4YMJ0_PORPP|nr:hypothetical protein FVE85_3608 [Porphyridium purpureum]|eukprot:POR2704..scf249_10
MSGWRLARLLPVAPRAAHAVEIRGVGWQENVAHARRWIHASAVATKKKGGSRRARNERKPSRDLPIAGAQKWPWNGYRGMQDPDLEDSEASITLRGPFRAIRRGRFAFRGIVLDEEEFMTLAGGIERPEAERFHSLKDAIQFCSLYTEKSVRRFFAFRHGLDGARGLSVDKKIFQALIQRFDSPTCEKLEFSNMVQPLVFCLQAGTYGTDWHTLEDSVIYIAKERLKTPALVCKFSFWSAEAPLRTGSNEVASAPPMLAKVLESEPLASSHSHAEIGFDTSDSTAQTASIHADGERNKDSRMQSTSEGERAED